MTLSARSDDTAEPLFSGPSEMAARCRAFDWSSTPLGPVSAWPQSLRTIVSTMLATRHPMFLWWGPDLIQIFNDGYLPSFGTSGRDVAALGAKGQEHWDDIWPVIGPQIEQVMTTGEATWHENHLVPIERNGSLENVWWTYGYSPVRNDHGEIAGVLVVVQETTSHVQLLAEREAARATAEAASERLHDLFRQVPAFVAVLRGPDFIFEIANDGYNQLVGHRDIIGKPVFDALPDARGQGYEELLHKVMETGEAFFGRELPIKLQRTPGAEMEERYVNFVYAPLTDPDGTRSGVFVHGVDVTDQILAQQAVENSNRQLESARAEAEQARAAAELANRSKGEFLAAMSHELRTPLNAIAGYAQLIELGVHGPVTDAQKVALDRIQRSERHLLSLVNDVLNFAKMEAGRLEYHIDKLVLADVVTSTTQMVEPQIRAKGLEYNVRITHGLAVNADSEKLQQILLNLLSNAIKFSQPGGGVWVDTAQRLDERPNVVYVRVCDNGIGIPREKQEAIFDPFVQIDRDRTWPAEGTGLGLAISRDLARGMGGDLRVRSTPGQGSTFTVTLPMVAL